jgi:uncharacterized FlgJ-related protein
MSSKLKGSLIILILILLGAFLVEVNHIDIRTYKVSKPVHQDTSFSKDNLKKYIKLIGIKHPDVVYAQAKLETGNFKSRVFRENNNLFGFIYKGKYLKFNNWLECCRYYKKWQTKYYKGGDYYIFLINIGYATDPNYNQKLKTCLN